MLLAVTDEYRIEIQPLSVQMQSIIKFIPIVIIPCLWLSIDIRQSTMHLQYLNNNELINKSKKKLTFSHVFPLNQNGGKYLIPQS